MKKLLILLPALLVGCAAPKVIEVNKPRVDTVNHRCADLARTVREVSALHLANVPAKDVQFLVTAPIGVPLDPIVDEVYKRVDITPEEAAKQSYKICVASGYDTMVAALTKADQENKAYAAETTKRKLTEKCYVRGKVKC